jgi:hypothetical protein
MPERDYHLAQADRHIAETKQLIARQRELVAALSLIKRPTEAAISMLEAFQKSLDALEHHRQLLLELFSPRRQAGSQRSHALRADRSGHATRSPRPALRLSEEISLAASGSR